MMKHEIGKVVEKAQMWIAWRLPRWLVKWAAVRLMASASCGEFSHREPGNISIVDALQVWHKG